MQAIDQSYEYAAAIADQEAEAAYWQAIEESGDTERAQTAADSAYDNFMNGWKASIEKVA